jgi:phosphonate transport system substrate-binding protein
MEQALIMESHTKPYISAMTRFCILVALLVSSVLAPKVVAKSGSGTEQIRIGFSGKSFVNIPKQDMKVTVSILSKKIAGKIFRTVESRIYDTTAEIETDMKLKKLDVLAITPDEFFYLKTRVPLEPAVITMIGNRPEVELLILVRKDSGFNRIADLKGKTIALPSWTAQYGAVYHTWIETLIMKEGTNSIDNYFLSFKETNTASKAIMPVFFRKIDACVVTRQALEITSELNPQISKDMKIIAQSDRMAGGLVVFRKDFPEASKQKTRQMLLDMHKESEGRQMLTLFRLNRLVPFHPEYMKTIEALYAEHSRLIARRR